MTETVYVGLVGESVDVWRPVAATPEGDNIYRLPSEAPSGERWQFMPGSLVRAEPRTLDDGDHLVAVAAA